MEITQHCFAKIGREQAREEPLSGGLCWWFLELRRWESALELETEVDFIVGNPPFLGDKMMRGSLGDAYVDQLRGFYGGRVSRGADLCCYWFEKARRQIQEGKCQRAGLLSTNSIRTGANRQVLDRISQSGGIFMAWSDREWILDGTGRSRDGWIVDFVDAPLEVAAGYELPFEYVRKYVKPGRDENRDARMRTNWWLHGRHRPALRQAILGLRRCIVTPEVAKYRLFVWMDTAVIPDHKLHVFARDDDYFFGVLHSRVHELWSLAQCSWMGVGNDPSYSSSRTFGTFPLPWPPGQEPWSEPHVEAIAAASRTLVDLRDRWLNPPDVSAEELETRTLTDLYNQRPTWLDQAHQRLDAAVCAAYGWEATVTDGEILQRLLELNRVRAACAP